MNDSTKISTSDNNSLDTLSLKGLTINQIVDRIAVLLQTPDELDRKLFDDLHSAFYKSKKELELSGESDSEQVLLQEARLNDFSQQFRSIERKRNEALAALQLENGSKVEALLEKSEALISNETDFSELYSAYKNLQKAWLELRPLNQQDESRLGKRYVAFRDKLYSLDTVDAELVAQDYALNAEEKRGLLAELKELSQNEDIVSSLALLNNTLVGKWRDVGPVAPELRREIEGEYKRVTTEIFKRHQAYQEELKVSEGQNATYKEELIDKIIAYTADNKPQSYSDWNAATDVVKTLQSQWYTIGQAGKRNHELFVRYKEACNIFFGMKQEFMKQRKQDSLEGIALRRKLIERAKELSSSTDYAETTKALLGLQAEWKALPHVRKAEGDALWQEFRKPLDEFYQRKRDQERKQHFVEKRNEEGKKALLSQLRELSAQEELPENLRAKLTGIKDAWKKFGRASDEINDDLWAEFCQLNDALYERLRSVQGAIPKAGNKSGRAKSENRTSGSQDEQNSLSRKAERLRSELRNYENNINFLSISNKEGNSLLQEIERKKQLLVDQLASIESKLAGAKSR